jgi:hypothetical protein
MSTLEKVSSKVRLLMAAIAVVVAIGVGVSVFTYLACEETAEASGESLAVARQRRAVARKAASKAFRENWERHEQEREERWKRDEESQIKRREMEALHDDSKLIQKAKIDRANRRRTARDKMWLLKSPSALREALWRIPRTGGDEATVEGLLRVCVSEAGWRPEGLRDCAWIWQVVQNIRSRSCDTNRGSMECDEGGETNLSALRRLSGRVLDESKARTVRQRFISRLDSSCKRPLGFPRGDSWERNLQRPCERIASEVHAIVSLKADRNLTNGAIPIAWGGRCEDSGGACDDAAACSRGLARIPDSDTYNAFWCRPGSPGCSARIDPVCSAFVKQSEEVVLEEPSH